MSVIYENLHVDFSSLDSKMDQLEKKLDELENAFLFLDFLAAGGLAREEGAAEGAGFDRKEYRDRKSAEPPREV